MRRLCRKDAKEAAEQRKRYGWIVLALLVLLGRGAWADEVVITLGGDCVLGTREEWKKEARTFDTLIAEKGMDWCFSGIAEPFQTDDISLVNLECVLQEDGAGHLSGKTFTFRGDPSFTEILQAVGIEQVNLANNHYIDFGRSGRESTRAALEAAGLGYSGYTYRSIVTVNGHKIGFAGCRETVYLDRKGPMHNDLAYLQKQGCDVILYSCHWGKEYSPLHNKTQERMADYALSHGADLVIGTHPHCVQGIERRKGGVVLYSLGNLVFGGTHDMTTFDALVAQAVLSFDESGRYQGVTLRLMPVLTSSDRPRNNFRPEWAKGEDAKRILSLIQEDSPEEITSEMWFPAP